MSGDRNDYIKKSSTPRTTSQPRPLTGNSGLGQDSAQPLTTNSGEKPPPPRR